MRCSCQVTDVLSLLRFDIELFSMSWLRKSRIRRSVVLDRQHASKLMMQVIIIACQAREIAMRAPRIPL